MRPRSDEHELVRFGRQDALAQGVTRIDRETLEGVMREDVFLAGDGKALAFESSDIRTHARRTGRRGRA